LISFAIVVIYNISSSVAIVTSVAIVSSVTIVTSVAFVSSVAIVIQNISPSVCNIIIIL